ncbi:MAG: serpin family protein [Ruminococcaceae bacterium]|nr:serpin family protein [Oscillospiraceae bacterium]
MVYSRFISALLSLLMIIFSAGYELKEEAVFDHDYYIETEEYVDIMDEFEETELIETAESETEAEDYAETELENNNTEDEAGPVAKRERIPDDELEDVFTKSVAGFSDSLYAEILADNTDKNNIVLSPLSVYYALSLISNGADGQTLSEIETALGSIPVEQLNEYLLELTDRLTASQESTVVVGNSTWTNSDRFTLSQEFIDTAKKYYYAEATSLPFNNTSLGRINGWVNDKTDGMIPSILSELDSKATMVLINTILFDGKWEVEYKEQQISDANFYNYDGTTTEAEFLYSQESGSYFTVKGGVGFTKKYKDGFRFTAVLPTGNIDDFMNSLDIGAVIEASFSPKGNVKAYIPKFEYEYYDDLTDMLKNIGIESAMTDDADFYALSADGMTNSRINSVIQKAKITLTEKGTKAAAATAVITYGTTSMTPQTIPVIRLDKPFFYMIVDEAGVPLFIGTVYSLE